MLRKKQALYDIGNVVLYAVGSYGNFTIINMVRETIVFYYRTTRATYFSLIIFLQIERKLNSWSFFAVFGSRGYKEWAEKN